MIRNAINEIIANFLYNNIFIYYNSPRELLFDNEMNFLNRIITLYLAHLKTRYRIITLYYFHINDKVKNLDKFLSKILIKCLIKKSIKL